MIHRADPCGDESQSQLGSPGNSFHVYFPSQLEQNGLVHSSDLHVAQQVLWFGSEAFTIVMILIMKAACLSVVSINAIPVRDLND